MSKPENHDKSITDQWISWKKILDASQQLVQLAEQKNWSRLERLQQDRDQLIEQFFLAQPHPELISKIQSDIKTICDQDRKIIQMVEKNREQLGAEAQRLKSMKNRIQQYVSTEKS
ncbi:flagellar protein FliT [Pseudohongiella spirulinae]|uniref:Flagellar protein FliT n=1 Tax=Pseudohongiella spirulinae TaxID=1249552 RepID=A0A0S2KE91_9GAMM|nr:flagellar protein FliT [Pseudohongiella spirulinae]ALO46647.1 hypothetical protein PS2015_2006 [Pseudohongiella spirulinae]